MERYCSFGILLFLYPVHPFLAKKQDFLEASPYWDQKTVPVNTWKNKAPYTAKVVSCKRIVGPEATGETCHIIMNHVPIHRQSRMNLRGTWRKEIRETIVPHRWRLF